MMTRRKALKTAGLAGSALAICPNLPMAQAQPPPAPAAAPSGPFKLPALPYSFDALEPSIDARTMEIHHDKHHAAYVANLNKAVAEYPNLGKKSVEDLLKDLDSAPAKIQAALRNQGGGHYNHSLFWQTLAKNGGGEPKAEVSEAIAKTFGSFPAFKTKFSDSALKLFGSGWAWLVIQNGALKIETTPNQDSPVSRGEQPLLGIDLWEHAYYLKYQNRRADYIASFWNVVNWDFVADRFAKSKV
jgi:Fe-Mn family superoxide dismutase